MVCSADLAAYSRQIVCLYKASAADCSILVECRAHLSIIATNKQISCADGLFITLKENTRCAIMLLPSDKRL